jgi:hypothetical protein
VSVWVSCSTGTWNGYDLTTYFEESECDRQVLVVQDAIGAEEVLLHACIETVVPVVEEVRFIDPDCWFE